MNHLHFTVISFGIMLVMVMMTVQASGLPMPARILFMKPNSVGYMYVQFSTALHNQRISLVPVHVFDTNQSNINQFDLSDSSIIPNRTVITLDDNSTVIEYTVTAKNNLKGLFSFSLPEQCYQIPLVIGLDNSQINLDILSGLDTVHGCMTYPPPITAELVSSRFIGSRPGFEPKTIEENTTLVPHPLPVIDQTRAQNEEFSILAAGLVAVGIVMLLVLRKNRK